MKEKIESLDFNTMTEEDSNELLNELLQLDDENLKDTVISIIDKMEISDMNDENIPKSYEVIFNDEKIKGITENLLEEYDKEI